MTAARSCYRTVIATLLAAAWLSGSLPALAQGVPSYYDLGAEGPTVVPVDRAGRPVVPTSRPELSGRPPVPVPHVMNGGGFGLTGHAYYNDSVTEGRFGARHARDTYVLAPAYVGPLGPR